MTRIDGIIVDVAFALRQLRRSPVLGTAAILCFALGIGVNSAIFSIVNGVLIRPLPYRDADRIVTIDEGLPKQGPGIGRIAAAEIVDYRELEGRVFQATAIYEPRGFIVPAADGSLERVQGAVVSGSFLRVLGREPALGSVPQTWLDNAANPSATAPTWPPTAPRGTDSRARAARRRPLAATRWSNGRARRPGIRGSTPAGPRCPPSCRQLRSP